MSPQTSIGEPFLLSSYSIPQKKPAKTGKKSTPTSLHATFTAKGSSEGYVTVAAQADGVHVLDVSTLHPVISHTLGPATSFACPAVTSISSSSRKNVCTTYAAIASSSSSTLSSAEVSSEDAGKTIWSWQEDLSSPLADRKQERKSFVVPYLIHGLYSCPSELDGRAVVTGERGELTVIDSELDIKASHTPADGDEKLLKTFVLSRKDCTFVSGQSSTSKGVIITSIFSARDSIRAQVQSLDEDDSIMELGACEFEVKPEQISSLSLSSSGCLTILSRGFSLQSYILSVSSSSPTITSKPLPSFTLTSLAQPPSQPSILALTSTHVLLASSTTSQEEIALLLWDMHYSVLLTSHIFPVPSSVKECGGVSAQLVYAGHGQAVCILTPLESKKQQAATSTVLIVPHSIPPTSTIANALGKALSGARWVKKDSSAAAATPAYSNEKIKVIAGMRTAMGQNRTPVANEVFFSWAKKGETAMETDTESNDSCLDLDYTFVKDVLNIVLQIGKTANAPYSSEVIRYLLENKVVSTAMVEGGLLGPLRVKNDWKSIEMALENVVDLTETELVAALYVVLAHHRLRPSNHDEDAMDVDQPSNPGLAGDIPSVASFLSMVLDYATTSTPLRVAIHAHFKQAEDLTTLLRVLNSWLAQWNGLPMRMLPTVKELHKDENGAFVLDEIVFKEKKKKREVPPLNKIIYFLQTVLDAGFVTLLTHTPAQKVLKQIYSRLESEIQRSEQFQLLRGPLESFVQAQAKAVKEAARKKEKGKGQPLVDWRQRKKQAHVQAGMTIGAYQLEELLL